MAKLLRDGIAGCRLVKDFGASGLRALLSVPLPLGFKSRYLSGPAVTSCFLPKSRPRAQNLLSGPGFMDPSGRNLLSLLKVAKGGDGGSRRICGNG